MVICEVKLMRSISMHLKFHYPRWPDIVARNAVVASPTKLQQASSDAPMHRPRQKRGNKQAMGPSRAIVVGIDQLRIPVTELGGVILNFVLISPGDSHAHYDTATMVVLFHCHCQLRRKFLAPRHHTPFLAQCHRAQSRSHTH